MAAIVPQLTGYRLFAGEIINSIINIANNMTGNGTPQALTANGQTFSGTLSTTPQLVTAAGATQGNATAITSQFVVVNVATTNSSKGVLLPAATTGRTITVTNFASHGNKIYPGVGAHISAAATNIAISIVKNKSITFRAVSTIQWLAQAGA
jgi:hypothetical protein